MKVIGNILAALWTLIETIISGLGCLFMVFVFVCVVILGFIGWSEMGELFAFPFKVIGSIFSYIF